MMNVGYLSSDKTASGDEVYTPYYAVAPLLKFIPKDKKIWCPFDEEWSAFYNTFQKEGYKVIRSSISENKDFFEYEPSEEYDVIISNPPYSKKDQVLKRCIDLDKSFVFLLPLPTLQGISRYKTCFVHGIGLLSFDKRIGFHTPGNMAQWEKGNHFASSYFFGNGAERFLPELLVLEELSFYNQPLISKKV